MSQWTANVENSVEFKKIGDQKNWYLRNVVQKNHYNVWAKGADRMANSADPDKIAPFIGEVYSRSTLFAVTSVQKRRTLH